MKFILDDQIGGRPRRRIVQPEDRARVRRPWKHGKLVHGSDQERRWRCVDRLINDGERQPRRGGEGARGILASEDETAPASSIAFELIAESPYFPAVLARPHINPAPRAGKNDKAV